MRPLTPTSINNDSDGRNSLMIVTSTNCQLFLFSSRLCHRFQEFLLPPLTNVSLCGYEAGLSHHRHSYNAHSFLQLLVPPSRCHLPPHCRQIDLPLPVIVGALDLVGCLQHYLVVTRRTLSGHYRCQPFPTLTDQFDRAMAGGYMLSEVTNVFK